MALNIRLEASDKPATIHLALDGQLDAVGAPELEKRVNSTLDLDIKTLILDLTDLSFISSAGLRVFAKTQKSMNQRDGRVLFVNLQPQVRKVFNIVKAVRLSDIFVSYAELDEYLEAMQREGGPER